MSSGSANTAPDDVRFCLNCGGSMSTQTIAGIERRVCDGCDRVHYVEPKIAVGAAVFRDDRILLVQRSMKPGHGQWTVPGGYVDLGRDPRAEAAREVMEEAGLAVEVGRVIDVFVNAADEGHTVFMLFAADWVAGEPVAGDDAADARFFGRDELPPLHFDSTHRAVAEWPTDLRQ